MGTLMAQYLIVTRTPITGTEEHARILQQYPVNRAVSDTVWIIRSDDANDTAKGISEKIFPPAPGNYVRLPHIVFVVSSYWGRYDRELWEWMTKNKDPLSG